MSIWDNAPDWAQWVATDNIGTVWFYEKKPHILFAVWWADGKMKCADANGDRDTWRESLRQRPGAEEATQ